MNNCDQTRCGKSRWRRAEVGATMLDTLIAWARTMRVHHIELSVSCASSAAYRLYRRAGFAPTGTPDLLRPGSPLLAQSMRLDLRRIA